MEVIAVAECFRESKLSVPLRMESGKLNKCHKINTGMIRSQATCGDFLDNRSAYLHHCYLNGIPGSSWSQRPSILHLE